MCLVRAPDWNVWLILSAAPGGEYGICGFEPRTLNPQGPLNVVLRRAHAGWLFQIAVGYR